MTILHALVTFVVIVGVPFLALYGLTRLSRWLTGQRDPIDALIRKNAARPRDGMRTVDWQKTEKAGEQRWQEAVQAQRRTRTRTTATVVPWRTRA